MAYRSEREAARLRDDAAERTARELAEEIARAEEEEREEQLRAEREPALRKVLLELSKPQPPFVRREQAPPSREGMKVMGVFVLGIVVVLVMTVVFVALTTDPRGW